MYRKILENEDANLLEYIEDIKNFLLDSSFVKQDFTYVTPELVDNIRCFEGSIGELYSVIAKDKNEKIIQETNFYYHTDYPRNILQIKKEIEDITKYIFFEYVRPEDTDSENFVNTSVGSIKKITFSEQYKNKDKIEKRVKSFFYTDENKPTSPTTIKEWS